MSSTLETISILVVALLGYCVGLYIVVQANRQNNQSLLITLLNRLIGVYKRTRRLSIKILVLFPIIIGTTLIMIRSLFKSRVLFVVYTTGYFTFAITLVDRKEWDLETIRLMFADGYKFILDVLKLILAPSETTTTTISIMTK
jgi:hypothetical protein